tara:strand:- start:26 stop:991 length:966 start_codon:yes stop_codon:yes gene_type:complete
MKSIRQLTALLLFSTSSVWAETPVGKHSLEPFAESIFETFRKGDFDSFHRSTVFAMDDEYFKRFLMEVNNDSIRNNLTKGEWSKWQKDAEKVGTQEAQDALAEKWEITCLKEWRKVHRRLLGIKRSNVLREGFEPILRGAEKDEIQWETCRLKSIKVVHEISVGSGNFVVDGIPSSALYWEPGLTYQLNFNESTHGLSFRLSTEPEGPIVYERGVDYTKSGNGSIQVKLEEVPRTLYYFCPDKVGMGNRIIFSKGKKHPKRNILLTFTYGDPQQSYRILLRDCLPIPSSRSNTDNAAPWERWLLFERPSWLGQVRKEQTLE